MKWNRHNYLSIRNVLLSVTLISSFGLALYYFLPSSKSKHQANSISVELPPYYNRSHIAHALGEVSSILYTNSWPAFLESYDKGFRVFEVDLVLLDDGTVVCFHSRAKAALGFAGNIRKLSRSEFLALEYGKEVPSMDLRILLYNLREFPKVELILDIKGKYRQTLQETLRLAKEINPEILPRLVPQIYGRGTSDLRAALDAKTFRYVLYTLYRSDSSDREVLDFLATSRVSGLVAPIGSRSQDFIASLRKLKIPFFVHPVDDVDQAERIFAEGVDGIFTSTINPPTIQSLGFLANN